jgi:hypothetical protein
MKQFIIALVIVGFLAGICVFRVVWDVSQSRKLMKPYLSYANLVYLASGCDDYKKQRGVWPEDINHLADFRPDLSESTTDAYGHAIMLLPYSEKTGCGELISFGRDGKPGGDNQFDRDIVIRFPTDMETNAQWNKQVSERFKSRAARGLW